MSFNIKNLTFYPNDPGVYIMKNIDGKVLYVGKANNLKKRIKQYFSKQNEKRLTTSLLIPQVENIEIIVVSNTKEALILEDTLIKKYKPKYNILLKDDKTYISIMLTRHRWPMLKLARIKAKQSKDKNTYFGPYTSAKAAKQILDIISRLFKLRQCSDSELSNRVRPCILFDMNRCLAPCVNKCSKKTYDDHVKQAIQLIQGKDKTLLIYLKKEMKKTADSYEFEKANEILHIIHQIEHITQNQHVANIKAFFCDVIGIYKENESFTISVLSFRKNMLTCSSHFHFSNILSSTAAIIENFLMQHYKHDIPLEIILPLSIERQSILQEILSNRAKKTISLFFPIKGKKKQLLSLANKNAKTLFIQDQQHKISNESLLMQLQEKLFLTHFPRHIECIDISNLSGKENVAAIIGFTSGVKDKSLTRLFTIKTEEQGDCPSLKHVLRRHLIKAKKEDSYCDLLIVDGSKGQLNAALDIFLELDIANIDIIAVSKEEAKHTKGLTQERIYIPSRHSSIIFTKQSSLLFFLQKIRDEAHRTAILFHRKKRKKNLIKSSLEDIPGIGPKKRKLLLTYFKSTERLKQTQGEELKKIKGLNKKDITNILNFIKNNEQSR